MKILMIDNVFEEYFPHYARSMRDCWCFYNTKKYQDKLQSETIILCKVENNTFGVCLVLKASFSFI